MKHYHIDVFEKNERGLYFVTESRPIYSKSAAERVFELRVNELAAQVGRFKMHKHPHPELPGAIKHAENHRLVIALSVCDCDGGEQ